MFQEVFLPELTRYDDDVKFKGKTGVLYWNSRELYISVGYNTENHCAGGCAEDREGSPRPEMERQDVDRWDDDWNAMDRRRRRNFRSGISRENGGSEHQRAKYFRRGARRAGRSGEVPLSPTIFNSNISVAKQKGAPVEWKPIDPVIGTIGTSGLVAKAPHSPCRTIIFGFHCTPRKDNRRSSKAVLARARKRRHRTLEHESSRNSISKANILPTMMRKEVRRVGRIETQAVYQQALVIRHFSAVEQHWIGSRRCFNVSRSFR